MTKKRICSCCGEEYPATEEYFYKRGSNLNAQCKKCLIEKEIFNRECPLKGRSVTVVFSPNTFEIGAQFNRREFWDCLGIWPPGMMIEDEYMQYFVVCTNGRKWRQWRDAGWPENQSVKQWVVKLKI